MTRSESESKSHKLALDLKAGISPEDTFRELFHLHYRPLVFFFLKRRVFSFQEAEELAQETLMRVFRGVQNFRNEADFRSWILSIAANVYRSELEKRSAAKRSGTEVSLDVYQVERPAEVPGARIKDPLLQLLDVERLTHVKEVIDQMPIQMRRCVLLRFTADLKYREIAELLQISIQTVKAHLFQARKRIDRIVSTPSPAPPQALGKRGQ